MPDWIVKQGDTALSFDDILTESGTPVNLSGCSVNFVMRQLGASIPLINAPATVVSASAGSVSFQPSATQTSVPGFYDAGWVVTFGNGGIQTFPTDGYLSVEIEQNLTEATSAQQLVSVADAKDILNFDPTDRESDAKVLRWINACRPLIESKVGPVIQQQFEEWHDGGHHSITLYRRPSTALGTSPFFVVNAISEYNGPIEWPLALVSSPDEGVLYSALFYANEGRVERRTAGGGVQAFPNMPQSVHVWYTAGQQSVPDNIYEATLEMLRENYQQTQQASRAGFGTPDDTAEESGPPKGFFMSWRVEQMLSPNRRFPEFA